MDEQSIKRISRLTAILTLLQSKKLLTASELAAKFEVSVRTIYRDIRALEKAGVPIVTEEGKGYSLMAHFNLPPIMFTDHEANALIMTEQLVLNNKDSSLVKDYTEAIDKIKSVLKYDAKNKANLLLDRTRYHHNIVRERSSNNLSTLQYALTHFKLVQIEYVNEGNVSSNRTIEPFAIVSTDHWLMIAYCRLRHDFRYFRLDRIIDLKLMDETFSPHKMTLQDYFDHYH
ncbi:helix-turn-helix transcriptional regulator [Membranihabitans marinus]|uniref:helix-turn-helix transcriptional regulator n=1 Tax=Membranihabitans marinus TaxID=1227546 RepID=UPI001F24E2C4|nr:YafY family protein [Membranihabitans marinus]